MKFNRMYLRWFFPNQFIKNIFKNVKWCSLQLTNTFLDGHSNPEVKIIGLKVSAILEHVKVPDPHEGPLRYSSVS